MKAIDIANAVEAFCHKAGINFDYEPEKRAFYGRYTMDNKHFRYIIAYEEDEIVTFVWADGIRADMGNNAELLKFINMVNWDIKSGRMTMDPQNGEIRFDNYIKAGDGCNLEEALENIMLLSIFTMERYYSAVLPLALGFSDAETEMKKVEEERMQERLKRLFEETEAS